MTNTTKSLACFVTGIALIATVMPVQLVLSQSGTLSDYYCKRTPVPPVPEDPTVCDRSVGDCETYMYIFDDIQECIDCGYHESGCKCHYWQGPRYQKYRITFVDEGKFATELGLSMDIAALCFIGTVEYTGPVAYVISVACGAASYVIVKLNRCDFGRCEFSYYMNPSISGPDHQRCN